MPWDGGKDGKRFAPLNDNNSKQDLFSTNYHFLFSWLQTELKKMNLVAGLSLVLLSFAFLPGKSQVSRMKRKEVNYSFQMNSKSIFLGTWVRFAI